MPSPGPRATPVLVFAGLLALAVNLRPAAVSVGPVLTEVSAELSMSPTEAGVLTALPVLAFAAFGSLTPRVARRLGPHRVALATLLLVAAGLALRAVAGSALPFLLWSLVALAGMAGANVLLPALVKLHAPDRVGAWTAAYTTALSVGLTAAFVLTVPIAEALGSWRWGLAAWAFVAVAAAVPWLALVLGPGRSEEEPSTVDTPTPGGEPIGVAAVARTPLGWAMAWCFGLQSLQAYAVFGWFARLYRDAGFSSGTAGLLLGVVAALSVPVSLVAPRLAVGTTHQFRLFGCLLAGYVVGYVGLLVAPRAGAWLWAALVGIGTGVFPLVLTLVGLRARTEEGTAALSGFTQSVGYLLAAAGPFGVGLLYEATGSWTLPLTGLLLLLVPLAAVAAYVSRPLLLEDQLRVAPRTRSS